MIRFSNYPARDLDTALGKEWLETNGIGGFASSTITGLNTRRYHGLLVAATKPPLGRFVLLSKLEETVIYAGASIDLSCNEYPGVIFPNGQIYLEEFRLDPFPIFVYRIGDILLEKQVFAVYGENTTVIEYSANLPCTLELRPLIAFRDYHSLTHRNDALDPRVEIAPNRATVTPYPDLPSLHFLHDAAAIQATGLWYENLRYRIEEERGLDYQEDLFNPFAMRVELNGSQPARITASTSQRQSSTTSPRPDNRQRPLSGDSLLRTLTAAADQFIVSRGNLQAILAGYHWFSDWGRDAMIALPGLTLATGRFDIAKNILLAFAGFVSDGMLPNRWPDAGESPEYNTVDATLWFFEAIGALVRCTGDYAFLKSDLLDTLASIVDWHVRGTRFGIHVAENGLLACGELGTQLTWMDARVNGIPVTPRMGMPVEIQALWYNALRWMQEFSSVLGRSAEAERYAGMASQAEQAFSALFWNQQESCLFDVIDGDSRDASIRPNQILAISLTHPITTGERARQVVERVQRDLLTPFGLRSLAPSDPQYVGRYEGPPSVRDAAYHQGTVWAWLIGPFITAFLRVYQNSPEAIQQAGDWLRTIEDHLQDAGLGQISEIFDGDPPHHPRGCIAQAWSVGEVLRVLSSNRKASR